MATAPAQPAPPPLRPPAPRFSLADCTADLLTVVLGFLGPPDRGVFATSCSFHLLVLRMVEAWGEGLSEGARGINPASSLAAAAAAARAIGTGAAPGKPCRPPSFGLGCVDRPRFLQPGERGGETVALVSYPRSGNSMLRGLLERVTGVVTGSDTRPDRVLSRSLLRKGLRGEGVVDGRAWVVKTHWPERYGYRHFHAHRVILLVRNPFDAINSYFNMGLTNTHEQTLADELYDGPLRSLWDEMLRSEVGVWARFNAHWLRRGLPLLAIRYEDLLLYPEEMLVRLVAFLERLPPDAVRADAARMRRVRAAAAAVGAGKGMAATGTGTGKQTHACSQQPAPPPAAAATTPTAASDPLHANRPRGGGGIGRAMRYYSPPQVQAMCELGGGGLRAFGYDPVAQGFPHAMLSLPPYERCVKFTTPDTAAGPCPHPPPPAGAAAVPAAAAVAIAAAAASGSAPVVTVNKGVKHLRQVRPADDKFGRSITKVRHALTEDDRKPLPTVHK